MDARRRPAKKVTLSACRKRCAMHLRKKRLLPFCLLLVVASGAGAAEEAPLRAPQPEAQAERPAISQTAPKKSPADAATTPAQPGAPTLDLESLENRLRETEAIGFMTKLTLKSQVDDLLDRFRAYYDGTDAIHITQLRQPYDTLILKVLALLQDKDPSLAKEIATSREAIWEILTDREKFSKL